MRSLPRRTQRDAAGQRGLVAGTQTFSVTLNTIGSKTVTAGDATDGTQDGEHQSVGVDQRRRFAKLQILLPGETAAPDQRQDRHTHRSDRGHAIPRDHQQRRYGLERRQQCGHDRHHVVGCNATLPANAALVAGTRTFSVTLATVGSQTARRRATDGTDREYESVDDGEYRCDRQTADPDAGRDSSAWHSSGKTGTPAARTAGSAFNVTVNAVDANWNVVSSTDTVAITSSDANATLPANAALVAGTQTFSVTLKTGGTKIS
jgi:hypothetical protein